MKRIVLYLILVLVLVLAGSQSAWAASHYSGSLVHVVKPGENLYRISLRYGTTVWAIQNANHLPNAHYIYVGQRLLIPTGAWHPPAGKRIHIVRHGETLAGIARYYGVNMYAIAQANHLTNLNRIYIGQRLVIPGGYYPPPGHTWYTVRRGDTLTSIAWRFGVNMWSIVRANHLANPNRIYVGQRLLIP